MSRLELDLPARRRDTYRIRPGRRGTPISAHLSRWVFLRLLGAIYLAAFASLWTQIDGLIGAQGILPLAPFLEAVHGRLGTEAYTLLPTLTWLDASDRFLHFLCGGGVALSLLVICGVAPAPGFFLLWVFYLSLVTSCRTFLGFQWDNLLLEAGLLAVFLAPLGLRPRLAEEAPPSRIAVWLLRGLLFKLMFLSGVVKLASGDPTWRDLTALTYHYETQPLPTSVGWYAHQLPAWFQEASVLAMFAVELGSPFFIFAPGRFRFLALFPLLFLQALIALTGNYAFFNLLTMALSILLVEDAFWPARFRAHVPGAAPGVRWRLWVTTPLAGVILSISSMQVTDALGLPIPWPAPFRRVDEAVSPFRSVNPYGLFAVMTTSRPEIVIEGSNDGELWRPYEFKWKPGDVKRRPRWVAPHQPRLDWQLWFAALGTVEQNRWFLGLLSRLAEGSPPVLALLAENPFPEAPPRYLRALVYDYRFTDRATRKREGTWWRRELRGYYCPVISRASQK